MPGLFAAAVLVFTTLPLSSQLALAQFTQQGPKLVGTGAVGNAAQGQSVALSANGNTAIVGGALDNAAAGAVFGTGAAWVYTRSGGVWTQQGGKLVGTGAAGIVARQGSSVALSADGNTAIVGGIGDNAETGAVWVFTRSGGLWTQQGDKLVGTGTVGPAEQGISVALSADGNTAIVGGSADNAATGAAWVFTRSGGVWTQQGDKLVGTDGVGIGGQGRSVALSADGNTAIVGGSFDNGLVGAAWVYTRSGGVWTQQGSKLVGTGAVGRSGQGLSVALSVDGNTAMVGGLTDNANVGAAWVYVRSGGVWTQQGSKLVGTGAIGNAFQGSSVALAGDGNTAVIGGRGDNAAAGATWVFKRSGGVWTQFDSKLVGTGAIGNAFQGFSAALSADSGTAIVGGQQDNAAQGAAWVFVQPILRVSPPSGTTISDTVGRPAPRPFFRYRLRSTFDSVGFAISGIPPWLNADFTAGKATTLPLTVTFSLINVANLKPGTYTAIIAFTNTSSGLGDTTRKVTLIVRPPRKHGQDDDEED